MIFGVTKAIFRLKRHEPRPMTGASYARKESLECSIFDMLCEYVVDVATMDVRGTPTVER